MKKKVLLILVIVTLLLFLGLSTGLLEVQFEINPSKLALYTNNVFWGMFGVVGGELLKLVIKRVPTKAMPWWEASSPGDSPTMLSWHDRKEHSQKLM